MKMEDPPPRLADRIWYRWFSNAHVLQRTDYEDLLAAVYGAACRKYHDTAIASDRVTAAFESMAHTINVQPIVSSDRKAWIQSKLTRYVLEQSE